MLPRRAAHGEEILKRVLLPAVLFTIAFAVRVLPWPSVFPSRSAGSSDLVPPHLVVGDGRVVFFGMDAWYHMRRVMFSLANGGATLEFDPYLNFPLGAKPIWSPLFDGLTALLLSPLYALGAWRDVEVAAALLPPVLGAFGVVATWYLAGRLFPPPVPALSGLLLCFLSAHFWYSQLGFVDHHVAVSLLVTLLLAHAVTLLAKVGARSVSLREGWSGYVGLGALAAFALLLWPGSVLHVGLVAVALLLLLATRPDSDDAVRVALGCLLAYGFAFALVLPFGWWNTWPQWGAYSPVVLSRFQPWMFASLALHAAGCALLWSQTRVGSSRGARAAQGLGIGAALLGASAIAFPGIVDGAFDALRWFTKDEVFQALVYESRPLFVGVASPGEKSDEGFSAAAALLRLSHFVWLFPIAVGALAWQGSRRKGQPALLLFVAYAVVLAIATLCQRRFFDSFSPVFAIVSAWSIVACARSVPRGWRATPVRRVVVAAALGATVLALFAPTLAAYRLPLENLWRQANRQPLSLPASEISWRQALDAAEWLRESTPATSGYLARDAHPGYGVLAQWGYGHLLAYVAQRPTVVGNFGDDVGEANMRRVEAYFRSAEPDAQKILDDLHVRYVLVETLARAGPRQLARDVMRSRLSQDDSRGLTRHRLLWESPLETAAPGALRSELRIFEYVPGASVEGEAPPGAQVRATLRYQSNRARSGMYENAATADANGRYRLRLPYATHGAPVGVETESHYVLECGGRTADVAVSEVAVREGLAVEGPRFARE